MNDLEELKRYHLEWWGNKRDPRNVVFKKLHTFLEKRIPQGNGKKALDLGSGYGAIVEILHKKGYEVTAVEINEHYCDLIKKQFPDVNVINEDIRNLSFDESFDVVTATLLFQYFKKNELFTLLKKISRWGKILYADISNKNSLHGFWVEFRRFKSKFVTLYTPDEFEIMLRSAGFDVVYRRGIGLITPITLFSGFRGRIIPIFFAKICNDILDRFALKHCHLYYVEAVSRKFNKQ